MLGVLWTAIKWLYLIVGAGVCTAVMLLGIAYLWATWAAREVVK